MKCGLCHREVERLSRSHIIPKALLFLDRPKEAKEPLLLMSSDPDARIKRSQSGIYSQIVCPDCESSFQRGDDALLSLCRCFEHGVPVVDKGNHPLIMFYPNISASDLHRGILTTLYRAHLSPHAVFNRVHLGERHAEAIRKLLTSDNSTVDSPYRMVLRSVPGVQGSVIGSPFRERWEGVNAYRLYFPHITAFVKVDQRTFHPPFHIAHLGGFLFNGEKHPHVIVAEHLSNSEEQSLFRVIADRDDEVVRYADQTYAPST